MSEIKLSIVDTFTDKIFHGQPVAVCLIREELNDELLLAIASENHYAETVFLKAQESQWHIRSFNDQGEIYSNGKGFLAAAFVYLQTHRQKLNTITFKTALGQVKTHLRADKIYLEYPYVHVQAEKVAEHYRDIFSIAPQEMVHNGPDVVACFASQEQLEQVQIQWGAVKNLISGTLILTAQGIASEIYCRSFSPRVTLDEETANPAIYPRLFHWWSEKLHSKNHLNFVQGLTRRSEIDTLIHGERLWVGGACRCYLQGELLV